jgi:hypothetical protein
MNVDSVFADIDANLRSLDIDEIKVRLSPLMIGYGIQSPFFNAGTFVYRSRLVGPTFNKSKGITRADLIYPPASVARLGRLNRPSQSVFYCSVHKESVFFELPNLKANDEVVLAFWKTSKNMFVNNIGYTEFAFKQLGSSRTPPTWQQSDLLQGPGSTNATMTLPEIPEKVRRLALSHDKNRELKELFSKFFMRQVTPEESFRYKLTAAIAEMHLGTIANSDTQFAGLLYPSVRMGANADNLALQPWFVDHHLEFRKAVHVRVKSRAEKAIEIDYVDAAHEFNEGGRLIWLGRVRNWTIKPKQLVDVVLTAGCDADGDYLIAKGGEPAHWVAKDKATGHSICRS